MKHLILMSVVVAAYFSITLFSLVAVAQSGDSTPAKATALTEADDWEEALSFDRREQWIEAEAAYSKFVQKYPQSAHIGLSMERLDVVREKMKVMDREMYGRIESTRDPQARVAMCEDYLAVFPTGVMSEQVKMLLEGDVAWMQERSREEQAFITLKSASDPLQIVTLAEQFKIDFGIGYHSTEVETILREGRKALEKQRRKVGKGQRVAGVVLMGSGVALGGAGLLTGYAAKKNYDDLESECASEFDDNGCPPSFKTSEKDSIKTTAFVADLMMGTGVVLAITGVLVYFLAPSWEKKQKENGASLSLVMAPTGDRQGAFVGIRGTL